MFLRPVVIRDADSANRLSLDRYDLIRARQIDAQPAPSLVLPNNQSQVLPPTVQPPPFTLSPAPADATPKSSTPTN